MLPEFLRAVDEDLLLIAGNNSEFRENIKDFDKKEKERFLNEIVTFLHSGHYYIWVGDTKGYFMKFYRGCFYGDVDNNLNRMIRHYLNATHFGYLQTDRDDIRARIKESYSIMPIQFNKDQHIINFKNGYLDTKTWQMDYLNSDDPIYYFNIQLPWEYYPDLTPTKFLPWLVESLEGDWKRIDLALKAMGYACSFNTQFQKLFLIKGKERTGKSTFINILNALVGEDNVSTVSLHRLSEKFGTSGIVGKLVNYFFDIPTNIPIKDTSVIKTLVDAKFGYEIKGGSLLECLNTVHHFFSTNKMPPVQGNDLAYGRRWVIIGFEKQIPENQVKWNWEFKEVINDKREMESILSLVMDAYQELCEEGGFKAQSAVEVWDMILSETDTVYKFVKECCLVGSQYADLQDTVYEAYADFSQSGTTRGEKTLKKPQFTNDLLSKGFGRGRISHKDSEGKRPYTYVGLKLKDSDDIGDSQPDIQMTLTGMIKAMVLKEETKSVEDPKSNKNKSETEDNHPDSNAGNKTSGDQGNDSEFEANHETVDFDGDEIDNDEDNESPLGYARRHK